MRREWRECTLGDLLRVKHGFAFKGEFFAEAGPAILLTPGNFRAEGGLKLKGDKEKFYTGPIPQDFVLDDGDLLVAMTDLTQNAPILGSAAFIRESGRYLHNQRLGKVTDLDIRATTKEFVYCLLNSQAVRGQIRATATGATVRHTAPSRIYSVAVCLPPLDVQRRIASILSAYDDLIENCKRRIRVLDEMARALYREWFVLFRYPGHEKVPLVESSLGSIPKGWSVRSVGETAENFDRRRKPLSNMQRQTRSGPYPYYGAAKVFDFIDDYIFEGEYLLMAEDGSVRTNDDAPVLQFVDTKFWANNHTHVLRGVAPISTHFLYLALLCVDISPYVTGAAQPKITQENMNRIPVVVASDALHATFAGHAGPLLRAVLSLERQASNLRRTRDLLLPRLLSGQLSVEDAA